MTALTGIYTNLERYRALWLDSNNPFARGRILHTDDDFVGSVHAIKLGYFNDGFRVGDRSAATRDWLKRQRYPFARVARDVWTEWLLQDNVVLMWIAPKDSGKLPALLSLDCEICEYSSRLGNECLTIRLKQCQLSDSEKANLTSRWIDAYTKGGTITLDPSQGECFRVLTRAKLGTGLGVPRLRQIFQQLSSYDLLQMGDWTGAWAARSVIRHFKKGHEIKQGPDSGKPTHFMKPAFAKATLATMKKWPDKMDLVSNFDLSVVYAFLNASYFDKSKYAGIVEQLELWAGPAALLRRGGTVSPNLMDMFAVEGRSNRDMVAEFLNDIFSDPEFLGKVKPPAGGLDVSFNPRTFLGMKLSLEWVRAGTSNGLVSPSTGREAMGVDDEDESSRMRLAHGSPQDYTTPYEAKQGMANPAKGGRPSDKPNTETPPTDTTDN